MMVDLGSKISQYKQRIFGREESASVDERAVKVVMCLHAEIRGADVSSLSSEQQEAVKKWLGDTLKNLWDPCDKKFAAFKNAAKNGARKSLQSVLRTHERFAKGADGSFWRDGLGPGAAYKDLKKMADKILYGPPAKRIADGHSAVVKDTLKLED